jgi:fatty acid desaturase
MNPGSGFPRSFGELPAEVRARLRALHQRRPYVNLVTALAFVAAWGAAGSVMLLSGTLAARLAGWLLIGAIIQGFGILMHEAVHGTMARHRSRNRWFGFLCGLPAILSVSAYRAVHLQHHRHERTGRDPDELENVTRDPRRLSLLFLVVLAAGQFYLSPKYGPTSALRQRAGVRRDILAEYAIIAAVYAALFALLPLRVMLDLWVVPALVAGIFTNVRTLAEHALTVRIDRLSATRTVLSNRIVSLLMCNLNFHTAHHLYPAVPWYNLPRVHRLLQNEFRAAGVQIYDSYTRFLIELAGFMARAFGPGGRELRLVLPAGRA